MKDAESGVARARARPSLARRVIFGAIVVATLLAVLELIARAAGLGDPDAFGGSRMSYTQIYAPLFRATSDGRAWRPRDPRLVDRAFPRATDAATRRIFVFGESAVAGLGASENGSFARALERRLAARGANVAVVNMGLVAVASRQILRVEKDVIELRAREPARAQDVFVFHVGNNEFIEALTERALERSGGLPLGERVARALERSRLLLGLKQARVAASHRELSRATFSTNDLRASTGERDAALAAALEPNEVRAIVDRHALALRKMCELARAAGATPVLMTVATNLEYGGRDVPAGGWLADAVGAPLAAKPSDRRAQLERARDRLAGCAAGTPLERWRARFQLGLVLRELGEVPGARAALIAARDEDPRLRRTLTIMNENVRHLASEQNAPLADAEEALGRAADEGIAGFAQLYDAVHLKPIGAERVAEELDRALARASLVPPLRPDDEEWIDRREAALAAATIDALDVREWLGWDAQKAFLDDPDMWKLETERARLDAKDRDGTASGEELVWAANGYALEVGGEPRARELYAKARIRKPELAKAIDANVAWLDARPR